MVRPGLEFNLDCSIDTKVLGQECNLVLRYRQVSRHNLWDVQEVRGNLYFKILTACAL